MVETAELFFSLLALVAQIFVGVAIVTEFLYRLGLLTSWRNQFIGFFGPSAMWIAFVVAAVTMFGSLYFSEVAHFIPCRLCWYQRICLYPTAVLLGLALLRRETTIRPYVIALAAICVPISSYHYLLEWYPTLEAVSCDATAPCTAVWFREFGYMTLPLMALTSAVTQITLMFISKTEDTINTTETNNNANRGETSG